MLLLGCGLVFFGSFGAFSAFGALLVLVRGKSFCKKKKKIKSLKLT